MSEQWKCAEQITDCLERDEWVSPNTYCNRFAPLRNVPAIYLFMLFRADDFKESLVAYVGMSTKLKQRIDSHDVLPIVQGHGFWTKVWFKPVAKSLLRQTEAEYIARFDPPWNIQGRVRGLVSQ